jgi:hypothetical protein
VTLRACPSGLSGCHRIVKRLEEALECDRDQDPENNEITSPEVLCAGGVDYGDCSAGVAWKGGLAWNCTFSTCRQVREVVGWVACPDGSEAPATSRGGFAARSSMLPLVARKTASRSVGGGLVSDSDSDPSVMSAVQADVGDWWRPNFAEDR